MSDDPRIGLRDEDLSPDEQATWSDDRARDAHLQRAHADALALGAEVHALPDVPPRAPARLRTRPWMALPAAAAMLVIAAPWVLDQPTLRARGVGTAARGALHLRAVAEGPHGTRVVDDGDTLTADERVVFEVEASHVGAVTLDEVSTARVRVWPPRERWEVEPGHTFVGDRQPAAWRSDSPGTRRYVAEWCDTSGTCVQDTLTLTWAAR